MIRREGVRQRVSAASSRRAFVVRRHILRDSRTNFLRGIKGCLMLAISLMVSIKVRASSIGERSMMTLSYRHDGLRTFANLHSDVAHNGVSE
jgi:hypothetical protein